MKEYGKMKYERVSNAILLTFTNPSNLNALSSAVLKQLSEALDEIEAAVLADRGIRSLILTGEGRAFIAGADIAEMNGMSPSEAAAFSRLGSSVLARLENFPVPVIAAVNGFALGGGLEAVLACDFAYASEDAKLGLPEATLGLIPGFSGNKRLVDRVGKPAAKEMLFTGRMLDAAEAYRLGIVNRVCGSAELIDTVIGVSEEFGKTSPESVARIKEIVNTAAENTTDIAAEIESNRFGLIFSHPDSVEGKAAFLGKRKPEWSEK